MQTLKEFKDSWVNTCEFHKNTNELFTQLVNEHKWLKEHRDYCDKNIIAFGERSFWWLFKLIIKELPDIVKACEIGVHRGGMLGLIGGLCELYDKQSYCVGISPFDGTNINIFRNYEPEVHSFFKYSTNNSVYQNLITYKGFSQDKDLIQEIKDTYTFNLLVIDGDHSINIVESDLLNYLPILEVGGYVLFDDSANNFLQPFGYFCGIQEVTDIVEKYLPYNKISTLPTGEMFEFVGSVVHLKVYQRIK